jgi:hypothetical protein
MTLLTRAALIDRYGLRLNMDQLAEVLGIAPQTLANHMWKNQLPIRTYRENGRRFASFEAVAEYLDACDEQAKKNPGGEARVSLQPDEATPQS